MYSLCLRRKVTAIFICVACNTKNGIDELLAVRVAERDSRPGSILPTHCVMTTLQKCKSSAIVEELVGKPGA